MVLLDCRAILVEEQLFRDPELYAIVPLRSGRMRKNVVKIIVHICDVAMPRLLNSNNGTFVVVKLLHKQSLSRD